MVFFTFAHSPECYLHERSDLALFLDLSQSEKLSDIKLTVECCRNKFSREALKHKCCLISKGISYLVLSSKNEQNHRLSTFMLELKVDRQEISCIFWKMGQKLEYVLQIMFPPLNLTTNLKALI